MAGLRVQKMPWVLLVDLLQHRWHHINELQVLWVKAHHVKRWSYGVNPLNIGNTCVFTHYTLLLVFVRCDESIQNWLDLGTDNVQFQHWVKVYSLDVFSDLDHVLLAHYFNIVFHYFTVFDQEALDVAVKLVGSVEKAFEHLDSQILTDLENIRILSNHLSEHSEISTPRRIFLKEILEDKIVFYLFLCIIYFIRKWWLLDLRNWRTCIFWRFCIFLWLVHIHIWHLLGRPNWKDWGDRIKDRGGTRVDRGAVRDDALRIIKSAVVYLLLLFLLWVRGTWFNNVFHVIGDQLVAFFLNSLNDI